MIDLTNLTISQATRIETVLNALQENIEEIIQDSKSCIEDYTELKKIGTEDVDHMIRLNQAIYDWWTETYELIYGKEE